jgi:hypothetical protein
LQPDYITWPNPYFTPTLKTDGKYLSDILNSIYTFIYVLFKSHSLNNYIVNETGIA